MKKTLLLFVFIPLIGFSQGNPLYVKDGKWGVDLGYSLSTEKANPANHYETVKTIVNPVSIGLTNRSPIGSSSSFDFSIRFSNVFENGESTNSAGAGIGFNLYAEGTGFHISTDLSVSFGLQKERGTNYEYDLGFICRALSCGFQTDWRKNYEKYKIDVGIGLGYDVNETITIFAGYAIAPINQYTGSYDIKVTSSSFGFGVTVFLN